MPFNKVVIAIAIGFAIAGCTTTQQAQKAMESRFIGQPSDTFFSRYGAPQSSFTLNNGSTIYRWRGGQTTVYVPAEYNKFESTTAGMGTSKTKTTTQVSHPSPNETVTKTTTTSFGMGVSLPQQTMISPARNLPVFCEAQITVDANGIITALQATNDTRGAGLSISRCAEVFDVN